MQTSEQRSQKRPQILSSQYPITIMSIIRNKHIEIAGTIIMWLQNEGALLMSLN